MKKIIFTLLTVFALGLATNAIARDANTGGPNLYVINNTDYKLKFDNVKSSYLDWALADISVFKNDFTVRPRDSSYTFKGENNESNQWIGGKPNSRGRFTVYVYDPDSPYVAKTFNFFGSGLTLNMQEAVGEVAIDIGGDYAVGRSKEVDTPKHYINFTIDWTSSGYEITVDQTAKSPPAQEPTSSGSGGSTEGTGSGSSYIWGN